MDSILKSIAMIRELGVKIKALEQQDQLSVNDEKDLITSKRNFDTFVKEMSDCRSRLNELDTELYSRTFKTADSAWIKRVTGLNMNTHSWSSFTQQLDKSIIPPLNFKNKFIKEVSRLSKRSAFQFARHVIGIFLLVIYQLPRFNNELSLIENQRISVQSEDSTPLKMSGLIQMTLDLNETPLRVNFMAAEKMDDADLWKCIAGTSALHNILVDESDDGAMSTWGVLTDGHQWRFIRIGTGKSYHDLREDVDDHGALWCSEIFNLDPFVHDHEKVCFMYRALFYIVKCSYDFSMEYREIYGACPNPHVHTIDYSNGREEWF